MTVYVVVSVFDVAAGAFGRPAFVPSDGVAVRSFADEVNRDAPDNNMFAHPEDFILYRLGTFDDTTALFDSVSSPTLLLSGKSARRTE